MTENMTGTAKRKTVRWAILGTGTIAGAFAQDIAHAPEASLAAVCSRGMDRAQAFAARFGGIRAYDDPAFLAGAPEIDAVYVASPNTAHFEQARLFLAAGKPVLIEKPFATTSAEARALAALAAKTQTFAMEAMWTAYLPAIVHLRAMLADNVIGAIAEITAEMAYEKQFDAESRFFSPKLGGGALLDLGVYPIALMLTLFGSPMATTGRWRAAATGVDMSAEARLHYSGFDAAFSCGFDRNGANRFVIRGETGSLIVDAPFMKASRIRLARNGFAYRLAVAGGGGRLSRLAGKTARRLPVPGLTTFRHGFPGNGLQFEIAAASRAILSGAAQERVMPLNASIEALEIIETIRAQRPHSRVGV